MITLPTAGTSVAAPPYRRGALERLRDGASAVLLTFLSLTALCAAREAPATTRAATLLHALVERPPIPLRVSPNGSSVLEKILLPDDFALRISDRATGCETARLTSPDIHLAATWSPDGSRIAYLAETGGNQRARPHVFNVNTRKLTTFDAPPTVAYRLAWHPSLPVFAYLVCGVRSPRGCALRLVDTRAPHEQRDVAHNVDPLAFFSWSRGGTHLATVAKDSPGTLLIVTMEGATQRLATEEGATIREITWARDDRSLLISIRGPQANFFEIKRISLDRALTAQTIATLGADLSAPVIAGADDEVIYRSLQDGVSRLFSTRSNGTHTRMLSAATEGMAVVGVSPDRDTVFALRDSPTGPPALFAVSLNSAVAIPMLAGKCSPPGATRSLSPSLERIRAVDGVHVPAFVWRANATPAANAGTFIFVHGGPALQALPGYDPLVQQLTRWGNHVIHVNYRGSTGYARPFEQADVRRGEDVRDVLAACEYARRVLRVEPRRIVLVGTSYGASLAIRAAWRDPSAMGTVVAASLAGPLPRDTDADRPFPRLLVYLGKNDALQDPAKTQSRLKTLFADSDAMSETTISILEREGHNFHRQQTFAKIFADAIPADGHVETRR